MEKWVPGLRQEAEFGGDVVFLDFDLAAPWRSLLEAMPGVTLEPASFGEWGRSRVGSVRHEYYHALLSGRFAGYEAAVCMDSDTVFQRSLEPLLELASRGVCCVAERILNRAWMRLEGFEGAEEMWAAMEGQPLVNCGLLAGPPRELAELAAFLVEGCRLQPVDQLWLNAWIYFLGKPVALVPDIWNFSRSYGARSRYTWYTPEGDKIAIYHSH